MRLRTGSDTIDLEGGSGNRLAVWFKAVRFHYVPPSFLPAVVCSLIAWSSGYSPDLTGFFLVVLGVTVNHFALNLLDDVCDFLHSVDRWTEGDRNPYTGGSGVLTEGLLTPKQVAVGAIICFSLTAGIGIYLTLTRGLPILAFGVFGIFCSVFYTLPPIKFGYRGLGEAALLLNFGPVIGLGAYYVQARTLAVEPFLVSLVLGFMMWSMITINEIPDYDDDRDGGKWNLVARFGRRNAIYLYTAGLVFAYADLVATVFVGLAPPVTLVALATVPLAVRSVTILRENYREKVKMMPANLSMIKVHFFTGVSLAAAYLVYWAKNGLIS